VRVESNLSKNGFLLPQQHPIPSPDQTTGQQNSSGDQFITCPNCGKVYKVVPGKKLRFCINCGKPFY
jgi:protein-arginine kinase activator protein McsA